MCLLRQHSRAACAGIQGAPLWTLPQRRELHGAWFYAAFARAPAANRITPTGASWFPQNSSHPEVSVDAILAFFAAPTSAANTGCDYAPCSRTRASSARRSAARVARSPIKRRSHSCGAVPPGFAGSRTRHARHALCADSQFTRKRTSRTVKSTSSNHEKPLSASLHREYFPFIDGLRAIAILGVMLFHYNLLHVSGGYVGVDVFFVLSGYLITGLIEARLSRGTFSFAEFYERRCRRILPALFITSVACIVGGARAARSSGFS